MRVGLCSANGGVCADPKVLTDVAAAAEEGGLDSIWVSEHLVAPDPKRPPSAMDPRFPLLDPIVSLGYIAHVTERILLGTGVIVLPLRNPLVLAKQLASLDVLSAGRVVFGFGVGYVEQEFAALNVPFEGRGERTTEYLEAIRAIWSQDRPSFDGRFYSFAGVDAHPRPVQFPTPRIVVGGASAAAMRRAVRSAHGWFGWGYDFAEASNAVDTLDAMLKSEPRNPSLGPLEITISPPDGTSLAAAAQYTELGIDRLNLILPTSQGVDAVEATAATAAQLVETVGGVKHLKEKP